MALHRRAALDEREDVFRDRAEGGVALAEMLLELAPRDPVVVAIPAGGVPVAVPVAERTGWPLDVAVVNKITLPWNTEAGYGALAFDGTLRLHHALIREVGLDRAQVDEGIAHTRVKVERRVRRLRGEGGAPQVRERTAILVDDGLASGFTMHVALLAVRACGAGRVIVAAPTGHEAACQRLAKEAHEVVCPNVRAGLPFAVANAYERWQSVPEVVADELLRPFRARDGRWAAEGLE